MFEYLTKLWYTVRGKGKVVCVIDYALAKEAYGEMFLDSGTVWR
jgi:hypothetical protein